MNMGDLDCYPASLAPEQREFHCPPSIGPMIRGPRLSAGTVANGHGHNINPPSKGSREPVVDIFGPDADAAVLQERSAGNLSIARCVTC